jgi:hypothetical protein
MLIWITLIGLLAGLGLAALMAFGSNRHSNADIAACAERRIEVSVSSSERSPALQDLAMNVMTEMALSAAVCAEKGEAVAVAGGGQIILLITEDDIAGYTPKGPNRAVREARLDPSAADELKRLAMRRLSAAYETAGTPDVSSVGALYADAAQHAGPQTDVVMILDGVQHDEQVDLNRPLEPGDGERLAGVVHIEVVNNRFTTLVGLAQVDASSAAPGSSWGTEVLSFNETACRQSQPKRCRLFETASVQEVLNP